MSAQIETAIFAAGCFWHIQDLFQKTSGVKGTRAGYTGGHTANPTYKQVCTNNTGHAEAVKIEYDPAAISYDQLLALFWGCHNPTTKDRQGADVGDQYRSAIFYTSPQQKKLAELSKKNMAGKYAAPIVTEITAAGTFYDAEEYHQMYVQKMGASH